MTRARIWFPSTPRTMYQRLQIALRAYGSGGRLNPDFEESDEANSDGSLSLSATGRNTCYEGNNRLTPHFQAPRRVSWTSQTECNRARVWHIIAISVYSYRRPVLPICLRHIDRRSSVSVSSAGTQVAARYFEPTESALTHITIPIHVAATKVHFHASLLFHADFAAGP